MEEDALGFDSWGILEFLIIWGVGIWRVDGGREKGFCYVCGAWLDIVYKVWGREGKGKENHLYSCVF